MEERAGGAPRVGTRASNGSVSRSFGQEGKPTIKDGGGLKWGRGGKKEQRPNFVPKVH